MDYQKALVNRLKYKQRLIPQLVAGTGSNTGFRVF